MLKSTHATSASSSDSVMTSTQIKLLNMAFTFPDLELEQRACHTAIPHRVCSYDPFIPFELTYIVIQRMPRIQILNLFIRKLLSYMW